MNYLVQLKRYFLTVRPLINITSKKLRRVLDRLNTIRPHTPHFDYQITDEVKNNNTLTDKIKVLLYRLTEKTAGVEIIRPIPHGHKAVVHYLYTSLLVTF